MLSFVKDIIMNMFHLIPPMLISVIISSGIIMFIIIVVKFVIGLFTGYLI